MQDLSGWRILIVEDESDTHEFLIPVLEHSNALVDSAFSGEQALEILEEVLPTIMMIDLALPGMDGWQLLETIQSEPELAAIPSIAMTAYHSNSVAQEAIKVGFTAYFPKPLNARTIVDDLVDVLS